MNKSLHADELDAIDRALEHYKNGIYQMLSASDDPQDEVDAELTAVNRAHKKIKKRVSQAYSDSE